MNTTTAVIVCLKSTNENIPPAHGTVYINVRFSCTRGHACGMAGLGPPAQDPQLRRVHVRTTMPIKMDPVRPEYYRAVVYWAPTAGAGWEGCCGEFHAEGTGGQISSRLLSLRSANALLEIPQVSRYCRADNHLLRAHKRPPAVVCKAASLCLAAGQARASLLCISHFCRAQSSIVTPPRLHG